MRVLFSIKPEFVKKIISGKENENDKVWRDY